VIDFVDFPVADVPSFHGGMEWSQALAGLATLCAAPRFAGLVVTEFNPDRDPDLALGRRFIEGLGLALAPPQSGA
jgi:arginase